YAKEHFPQLEVVEDFHLIVLQQIKSGVDAVLHFKENLSSYADKVIICDDISCGVVPTDFIMRKWREDLGHTLAIAAKESDEVVRIFCGIGTRLK
ncbi:MAG: bifunctional adenosylcobinamide kinase/adenosylcobinamide-phosphate guanylyltransferase, partial [Oscillospiraceae bacterium]